jgi:hypothetical protein
MRCTSPHVHKIRVTFRSKSFHLEEMEVVAPQILSPEMVWEPSVIIE